MLFKIRIIVQRIFDTLKKFNFKFLNNQYSSFKEELRYIKSFLIYKYEIAIEHYNDPEPWTRWYWFLRSRRLFIIKAWLLLFGVIFLLFWFGLFKLFVRYESLHWFMMIVWIFTVIVLVNYFLAY
jgi:hypothetical protein